MKKQLVLCLTLVFSISLISFAQESIRLSSDNAKYEKAVDLFEKEMFADAQKAFESYLQTLLDGYYQKRVNTEFHIAMCAIALNNQDAEYLIGQFILKYPESELIDQAYFAMGKIQYQLKKYSKAIYWLSQINRNGLDKEKQFEWQFMLGYCFFMNKDYNQANRWLYQIKDIDNKFSSPATYYYSHIAYLQKNYATALKGFKKLKNDELFAPIVPYYITHIYYLEGDYKKVTEYSPKLAKENKSKRASEIAKIVGDAFFKLKMYDSSLTYLKLYEERYKEKLSREDIYLLGFAYYKNNKYEDAAKYLERVATFDDSLSQNANYHLADCYLKLNDKSKARQAFGLASKLDFDKVIKEDALFNFAKLTYEQLYAPFNEAIDAFNTYIKLFPNSPRIDEAYNYLTLAYLSSKNYKEAVAALEKITNKDATIKTALQRAAFFRGLELFQNLDYNSAIKMFSLSLEHAGYNQQIAAQAIFWMAESYYRIGEYQNAATNYEKFILTPGAFTLDEYLIAHYYLGYAYFKLKQYDNAIAWYRKYINLNEKKPSNLVADSYNRIGDCFFIQRRYWAGIDYYEKAANMDLLDADYALFQRGFSLGLVNRPEKKINTLKQLVEKYPSSSYYDDAIFEIAEAYNSIEDYKTAIEYYKIIEKDYPNSSYYPKALVQLGLLYYNANDPDNSLVYYKKVVESYPNSAEAKNALIGIRNIYIDKGDADSYFNYASKLGNIANISVAEKDSLSYMAAEKVYLTGNCEKSIQTFNSYIEENPQGNFIINALFYMADCYTRINSNDKAIECLSTIAEKPKNNFTEKSLIKLSNLYFEQEEFEKAYEYYDKLESVAEIKKNLLDARIGKLRCAYNLNKYDQVTIIAPNVISTEKISPEIERETRFKLAHAYFHLNKTDDALIEFSKVAQNLKTVEGAESKYMKALIYFQRGEYNRTESEVFSFAENNTPHQYWLAKSFILLAETYAAQNDFFQAKATLQSVLDGYTNTDDGIIDEATDKLNELVKAEKERQTVNQN
ncbi:tetratricopeptide repeat protein [Tenuifilum thalassicum]|uniref:Tetratricopeptide repeat protein n=1 Tax=Tenuifilum thalassicum TaxID=2590900 RepID=A0A7D4BAQ3_9BACT|nr:tetratricopeptide repeat protein [Tenuifilum thalassicum]QKG79580.1 tetratricopeptide repeat protein [Tenuifilum thalassicum]